MKLWSFHWLLFLVVFASNSVIAQTELPTDASPVPSADGQLPEPLSAVPPPDPDAPAWGSFLDPVTPPIAMRQTEYNVVGPPDGFFQNIEGQDYQAVISDPNALFDSDQQIGQVIDINRPDGMAPIGVFGDHTLAPGKMFVSYRYLQNSNDQLMMGSHRISVNSLAGQYPFVPANMLNDSQIALFEYGVTKDLTMLMYLPFQYNKIDSQTSTGSYQASFANPGDIRVTWLYVLNRQERSQSHVNLGISVPVGLLETLSVMPSPTVPNLPYQLRTSSGTYDLLIGYTYRGQTDYWTWGAQANVVVPTGVNTLGYELGNQAQLTGWLSRRLTERFSASGRLDAHFIGNMRGADTRLNTALSPANLSTTQGTDYVNALLGVNFYFSRPENRTYEQRLFLETGVPLYQTVNGPQLGITWILNAGWGMSF